MKSDVELRSQAMELLRTELGMVESERFVTMLTRDTFDYTRWRRNQWNGISVSQLAKESREFRETPPDPS